MASELDEIKRRDLKIAEQLDLIIKLQAKLAAANECYLHYRNDIEILLDYFRNDMVGSRYGLVGDDKGWSTCKCAVETMKELSSDWHKAIIERNQMVAERDAALARAEAAEKELAKFVVCGRTGGVTRYYKKGE